ncbi:2-oxoglutarate dehydrogenase, E2 component, dihydrolipoamide succinyltransferase [Phytoactinopolyspora alkaliphila]|uniref:Dihydrolipoamide acetyltransferase component of pyruvate dehydrogenase complex n=1 Tax=Phytoactinopolyspora alkaliphila TaxID=1783498 RepID=A0A6N9YNV4_9ACTN|nr:2-oxoglutarate dehydrogenase, E2 component, dihydrolipoamide succinyltransferase [Phytoactinopolyspora alkaliphila]NED96652.1 2-oxoglutarate dehydrogenase, E2 component, dihydrolipoamide succinyltransferase [Phytoactinopolyspora alkaliphila]
MATSVTLPALGESVTEGTVTRWLKQPGDQVAVDEPLLEISTDKVDTEIPSPVAGVLQEIKVAEDETVEVGAELAIIGEDGEAAGSGDGEADQQADQGEADQQADQGEADQQADQGEADQQADQGEAEQAEAEQTQPEQQEAAPEPEQESETEQQREQQPAPTGSSGGTPVTLPALGESVTEGTVTRWLKQPGDQVAVDEPLLEISTDKVDTEIPSPVAGVLQEIKVAEDETVEVGAELAIIGEDGEAAGSGDGEADQQADQGEDKGEAPAEQASQAEEPQAEQAVSEQEPRQEAPAQEAAQASQPRAGQAPKHAAPSTTSGDGAPYVTPLVRKLAAEHSVDLSAIEGSGVGGRIRKQDVLSAAEAAKAAPEPEAAPAAGAQQAAPQAAPAAPSPLRGTRQKMSRIRKATARHMIDSLATSAQLTSVVEVDVTRIAHLRARAKAQFQEREGVKLSFLPFFAKAAVEVLKIYPILNASVEGEEIVYHGAENLGIAVDTERGLMVPVIKNAGDLNIGGLARQIADLAERTRSGNLKPDDIAGGTFTITNTGSRGALFDTPILNQPQVGMLATGAVVKRPVVVTDDLGADTIAIRSMAYLALTYDHRIVDGADAARYLTAVKQRLDAGQFEADLGL